MTLIKPAIYISKEQISAAADRLIARVCSDGVTAKWPQLADQVADFLDLSIIWADFEAVDNGMVAAKIYPTKKEIHLNQAFPAIRDNSGLYQSTLAHEVGHWVLHIDHTAISSAMSEMNLIEVGVMDRSLPEEIFLCRDLSGEKIRAVKQKTPEDWREWQAQYFASCLLMPLDKLEEVRRGRRLNNWRHLAAIADELGVTTSNLCNRLQDLEYIERVDNSKQLYLGKRLRLEE